MQNCHTAAYGALKLRRTWDLELGTIYQTLNTLDAKVVVAIKIFWFVLCIVKGQQTNSAQYQIFIINLMKNWINS